MKYLRLQTLALSMLTLAGCGGGGDDGTTTTAPPPPSVSGHPASGSYGWTLKASGPTTALKHGLSLAHPAMPENEYVVETASENITDTRLVSRGNVNTTTFAATQVQAHALVYIYGGDVRSVPMQANGSSPKSRVKSAEVRSACRFLLSANDYAQPDNSRFIVSTAGADGRCETADDGRAEVRLSAGANLGYTQLSGDAPLEVARDPDTLAPRGWIYPRQVDLWSATPQATLSLRANGTSALTGVVANTWNSALVTDGSRLSVVNFTGGAGVTETPLDAATTAGTWRLIGFDATHFYVYNDNPGNGFGTPWTVLRISRQTPTVSQVASGTGYVSVASLGSTVLYLTVFTQTENRLVRVPKAGGSRMETTYPITTKPSVQTSASGRHLQWLVGGIGSPNVTHEIRIVDESGVEQFVSAGGYPLSTVDAATENFNASESRTRFLFAQGFGDRAFSSATLVSYDAGTGTASTLGTLPGPAEYGNDYVFASASGGPETFGVGFATRSTAGAYAEQSARVFSYQLTSPNSLQTATRR